MGFILEMIETEIEDARTKLKNSVDTQWAAWHRGRLDTLLMLRGQILLLLEDEK